MIGLLQRVTRASVAVDGQTIAAIGHGVLALIGVQRGDVHADADRLLERLIAYRIFADENGRMNLSVADVDGGLLLVPQFTLAADTRKGNRPSFTPAADPAQGEALFAYLVDSARRCYPQVGAGQFGADMAVELCNDGPVTFWLETRPAP